MKVYVMAKDYGDGSAGVVFFKSKPNEEDLSGYEFEALISNLEDGTWLTFPDNFDLAAAGIKVRD